MTYLETFGGAIEWDPLYSRSDTPAFSGNIRETSASDLLKAYWLDEECLMLPFQGAECQVLQKTRKWSAFTSRRGCNVIECKKSKTSHIKDSENSSYRSWPP